MPGPHEITYNHPIDICSVADEVALMPTSATSSATCRYTCNLPVIVTSVDFDIKFSSKQG